MTYHEEILNILKSHVQNLENIRKKDVISNKVIEHWDRTLVVLDEIEGRKPENYRKLIEYLNQEGRNFGWSYPEDSSEKDCEAFFWKLKDSVKTIVQGMTAIERLYFFGYLDEYEKLKPIQKSAREDIELKLFMK